jgi:hypothetical protein
MTKRSGATKSIKARRSKTKSAPVNYLAVWREKSTAKVKTPVIEREFAGLPCKVRRTPLLAWIRAGQMPGFLAEIVARSFDGEDAELDEKTLTSEQKKEFGHFRRVMLCETVVEPRIVHDRAPQDGEISYQEVVLSQPEFVGEVIAWILIGCPDIPIETKGGALTVDELSNFRPEQSVHRHSSPDGSLAWETQPTPRNL